MGASWALAVELFKRYENNGHWVLQLSQILRRLERTAEEALATTASAEEDSGNVLAAAMLGVSDNGADDLLEPLPDPMTLIDGGMPFFHDGLDMDAIFYFSSDPFAALGGSGFGG